MNSINLSGRSMVTIAVVAFLLIIGGLILGQATPLLFPVQASAEATQVDGLFHLLLVIGGGIFLLVQGLLVYSIVRFRAKPGDTSDGANIHGSGLLEVAWTAVPAITVLVLTVLSYQVFVQIQEPKDGEMTIHAVGARFNWAFSYDVPLSILPEAVDEANLPPAVKDDLADDGMISVSSPILFTYVGRPIALEMQPRDVIHAFYVPAFRVKQDLIPGRTTTIRFTPTEAGTYPIKCAELCGANHGLMVAQVEVLASEADYNAALLPLVDAKVHPSVDPVVVGHSILASNVYPCYTCHVLATLTDAAAPWTGAVGPNLTGVGDRAVSSRAAATGLDGVGYLTQALHEPTAYLVPGYGPLMPNLNLQDCEVQAIVAYLCTQTANGEAACTIDLNKYVNECTAGGGQPPPPPVGAEATGEVTAEATSDLVSTPVPAEATGDATAEATSELVSTPVPAGEATADATTETSGEATAEATVGS